MPASAFPSARPLSVPLGYLFLGGNVRSLAKRVMKGQLTFMLDGFDMLHNLSNVTRSLNAQGRVETYRNVIPRYFMLHAVYRLNIKPNKLPGE